jgi:hypothetical protein
MPGAPQPYQTSWCGIDPSTAGGPGAPVALLGVFTFGVDGWLMGCRYFRDLADDFNHFGYVTNPSNGTLLGVTKFRRQTAAAAGPGNWESAYFHPRIPISASGKLAVSVYFGGSYFWYDAGVLSGGGFSCGNVVTDQDGMPYPNMQFNYANVFDSFGGSSGSRYGIDVIFLPS